MSGPDSSVTAFGINPKVGGSSPPDRDIFCLKNFDTFTRTPDHSLTQYWHGVGSRNPSRGTLYSRGLTSIPTWISNYIRYKIWDE